jgi:hypothetical protein
MAKNVITANDHMIVEGMTNGAANVSTTMISDLLSLLSAKQTSKHTLFKFYSFRKDEQWVITWFDLRSGRKGKVHFVGGGRARVRTLQINTIPTLTNEISIRPRHFLNSITLLRRCLSFRLCIEDHSYTIDGLSEDQSVMTITEPHETSTTDRTRRRLFKKSIMCIVRKYAADDKPIKITQPDVGPVTISIGEGTDMEFKYYCSTIVDD